LTDNIEVASRIEVAHQWKRETSSKDCECL